MNTSLQQLYKDKVFTDLQQKFQYKNQHEVPKLVKITLNRGIGEASQNAKALENSINEFQLITGQKPIVCLLYTSPSPRDLSTSRMPSSA